MSTTTTTRLPTFDAYRAAWALALAAATADLATTWVGLRVGLVETNPLARDLLDLAGIAGLVGLKLAALAVVLWGARTLPRRYRALAPAPFAIPQVVAVVINTYAIGVVI